MATREERRRWRAENKQLVIDYLGGRGVCGHLLTPSNAIIGTERALTNPSWFPFVYWAPEYGASWASVKTFLDRTDTAYLCHKCFLATKARWQRLYA